MNYVTPKDKEEINETIYNLKNTWSFSWANIAKRTGWSVTTVRNHYDENWFPGKYYKKPIPATAIFANRQPGVYLLAQQVVEDGKIINLIKVGKSTDLYKRLTSYKGMNPFAKCVDTLNCSEEELDKLEKDFHLLLGTKNQRYANTEWFICDDKQYNYWLENKFNIIRNLK